MYIKINYLSLLFILYFVIAWNYHLVLLPFGRLATNPIIFIRWLLPSAKSIIVYSAWIWIGSPLLLLFYFILTTIQTRIHNITASLAYCNVFILLDVLALLWSCVLVDTPSTFLFDATWIQLVSLSILGASCVCPRLSASVLWVAFISIGAVASFSFALLVWRYLVAALLIVGSGTSWLGSSCCSAAFFSWLLFRLVRTIRTVLRVSLIRVVSWVVQYYIWRKSFDNPFVLETFIRC